MSSDVLTADTAASQGSDLPLRHPSTVALGEQHVGITLVNAREARGMTMEQLAAQLKISPKKLGALERGEFDQIEGGATYVRALCRSVCKALRMDEVAVLDRLPSTVRSNLPERDTSLRTPFKEHTLRDAMSMSSGQRKGLPPLVWAAAALAVLSALVFAWPWISTLLPPMTALPSSFSFASSKAPNLTNPAEASSAAAPISIPIPAPTLVPASGSVPMAAATAISGTPSGSASSADAAAVDPAQALIIEAAETTWVEIKSPGGVILVSRNVIAGERLLQDLDGKRVVTIGNVSGARVLVRGKSFDLLAFKKDNVARFDVQ